ncbi:ABC transporter permease subunit [Salinicoccus sp. ID82-1]|uniref:PhnE/PtxC family ABC transporter permease n=1 Tax=Salinicoccus sp. ID82-1 TaxID=2820269 RepID=UPI001F01C3D8|nr:ABC transporter permease subunit [Salinicoccus sp. ID82-1]MCG1008490.1 ABC transporter permease subunit [Salinicoccus sp. ID82-1]
MSTYVERNSKGNIKISRSNKGQMRFRILLIATVLFTIAGFFMMDYKGLELWPAITGTIENIKDMFLSPQFNQTTFGNAVWQVIVTLSLAFLSTVLGAVLSLFLAFGTAMNLSKPWLSNTIKAFITVVRAVPTVLWVLIFAIAAGLGSVAAVIGMVFHSIAYLVKAYSEAFEEIDEGKIEALRATGSSYTHILFHVVIPQTKSFLIAWTFLRFEINFGVAVAMGAAAGAGGIGYELFMSSGFYYDMNEVGAITYMILIVAIILEVIANKLKAAA